MRGTPEPKHTHETVPFSKRNFMNGCVLKFLSKPFWEEKKKCHASNVFVHIFLVRFRVLFERDIHYRPFVEILTTSNSSTECTIAGAAPRARRPLAIKSILTSAHKLHIGTTQLCNKKTNCAKAHNWWGIALVDLLPPMTIRKICVSAIWRCRILWDFKFKFQSCQVSFWTFCSF